MSTERRRDGTPTAEPQPARGYKWEPFKAGNTVSTRHGAFSERVISEAAEQIRDAMLEQGFTYFADPTFMAAVERYTRAEARAQLLHRHCMQKADDEGVEAVRPYLWQEAGRAEANAARFASDCGLDARGRAVIARDLGFAQGIRRQVERQAEGRKLGELGRELREAQGRLPA